MRLDAGSSLEGSTVSWPRVMKHVILRTSEVSVGLSKIVLETENARLTASSTIDLVVWNTTLSRTPRGRTRGARAAIIDGSVASPRLCNLSRG